MKKFIDLPDEEKKEYLDKEVSIVYSGPDMPNGNIGPQKLVGKIVNYQIATFDFYSEIFQETLTLTMEYIDEIQLLE